MYKLHYLGFNAKGNTPRAILNYAQVKFENKLYTKDDLAELKKLDNGLLEYKQVPILELPDGKRLSQAIAINTYLSKKFNLYGDNDLEGSEITSIFCTYEDFWPKFRPIFFEVFDFEKGKQDVFKKNFFDTFAPMYLSIYERRFNQNNTGFIVGKRFSGADIWLTAVLYNMFLNPARLEKYPEFEGVLVKHAPNLGKQIIKFSENELKHYFDKSNKNGFIHNSNPLI